MKKKLKRYISSIMSDIYQMELNGNDGPIAIFLTTIIVLGLLASFFHNS